MKLVLVKSVYEAFEYVMQHYAPIGGEEQRQRSDKYAVISIQDSIAGGFGVRFTENDFCTGALTLLFDDIEQETEGAALFSEAQADSIIDFIRSRRQDADTLLVNCCEGQRRSRAVGAFAARMLGEDFEKVLSRSPANMFVFDLLCDRWIKRTLLGN